MGTKQSTYENLTVISTLEEIIQIIMQESTSRLNEDTKEKFEYKIRCTLTPAKLAKIKSTVVNADNPNKCMQLTILYVVADTLSKLSETVENPANITQ